MLNPHKVPSNVIAAAIWSAIAHFSMAVIIQMENYFSYVATDVSGIAGWLVNLPFIQLENLIFAGLLGILAIGLVSNLKLRWLFLVFAVACNAYLVVDQLAYKIFFDHINYKLLEADYTLTKMLQQLVTQADFWVVFNSLLVAASAWLLYQVIGRQRSWGIEHLSERTAVLFNRPVAQIGVVVFGFFSVIVMANGNYHNLDQHAVFKSFLSIEGKYREVNSVENIYYPRFGEEDRGRNKKALGDFRTVIKKIPRPNIVLMTVKTRKGHDARNAILGIPAIAEIFAHGAYFPQVYHPWPSQGLADWLMISGAPAIDSATQRPNLEQYQNTQLAHALQQKKYVTSFLNVNAIPNVSEGECITQSGLPITDALAQLRAPAAVKGQPFFLSLTTSFSLDTNACNAMDAMPIMMHQRSLLDQDLQALLQYLRTERLLKNTVFVIYGDVSQANERAAGFLRDDGAKGFAIVSTSQYNGKSIVVESVMQLANVYAMLLNIAGVNDEKLVSLLDSSAPARNTFFMDGRETGMWGLRDGNWKFAVSTLGGHATLYDLNSDAKETNNLASLYPQRIKLYQELCAAWYATLHTDLPETKNHFSNSSGRMERQFETGLPGPKKIHFGYYTGPINNSDFIPREKFNPNDPIVATVNWVAYPTTKQFMFDWQSPSGKIHQFPFVVNAGWSQSWTAPGFGLPMEEGTWVLTLRLNGQAVIAKDFVVDAKHPIKPPANANSSVVLETGIGTYISQGKFSSSSSIRAKSTPVFWTRWEPQVDVRFITFKWESPYGVRDEKDYSVRGDWQETWVDYEGPMPLERGLWHVSIWQHGRKLTEMQFNVVK